MGRAATWGTVGVATGLGFSWIDEESDAWEALLTLGVLGASLGVLSAWHRLRNDAEDALLYAAMDDPERSGVVRGWLAGIDRGDIVELNRLRRRGALRALTLVGGPVVAVMVSASDALGVLLGVMLLGFVVLSVGMNMLGGWGAIAVADAGVRHEFGAERSASIDWHDVAEVQARAGSLLGIRSNRTVTLHSPAQPPLMIACRRRRFVDVAVFVDAVHRRR